MRLLTLLASTTLVACVADDRDLDTHVPPHVDVSTSMVPDIRCAERPEVGAATGFRTTYGRYVAGLGTAYHRGNDLIASTADAEHRIMGKITYGPSDKDLQQEDVEVFACIDVGSGRRHWQPLGTARTDDNGTFALVLAGSERLPAGMRDLYVSVMGDRTGAVFIGFVAPPGAPVIVSDVDGTLTSSENAYPTALATGGGVAMQPDAAGALMHAALRDTSIVYITARGDRFVTDTRAWFDAEGFPRGPVRMPASIVTVPGDDTIEFKASALAALSAFRRVAGIGNRATDVAAYGHAGLSPDRIFIKLPEFEGELAADLAAGKATGFDSYESLRTGELAALLAE
jgi:phosphatidate phosphatase PAH1